MYITPRCGMSGFWSTMVDGSLDAGKVAVNATKGFVTGGPTGAIKAGVSTAAGEIAGAVKGSPKASASAGQQADTSGGATSDSATSPATSAPADNALAGMNNDQVIVLGMAGFALLATLMRRPAYVR